MDGLDKVVAGCGFSDSLEDIWGISLSMLFGCKVGVYSGLKRLQEVDREDLLKFISKSGFK